MTDDDLLNEAVFVPQRSSVHPAHRRGHKHPAHAKRKRGPYAPRVAREVTQCYVYFLVHAHESRFKIGLSNYPTLRANQLPEASSLDWYRSQQVAFPTRSRAAQIERMLHRALAEFRLELADEHQNKWDGSTEWFSLNGLHHAQSILRATPTGGHLSAPTRFELINRLLFDEALTVTCPIIQQTPPALTLAPTAKQQAARYNLERMSLITEVLTVLNWDLKIEVRKKHRAAGAEKQMGNQREGIPATIYIHGLKNAWWEGIVQARMQIFTSDLWEMQSGSGDAGDPVVPLVRLIRYSPAVPDRLELVVNELKLIRKLPAGEELVKQWRSLCERLGGEE